MFGATILGNSIAVPDFVVAWWHTTMQALLNVNSKHRKTSDEKSAKAQATIKKYFGPNFLEGELPTTSRLNWQLISPTNANVLATSVDLNSSDALEKIKARWSQLTPNARMGQYCQMTIGWMAGVVETRTKTPVELNLGGDPGHEIMEYGRLVGKSIPAEKLAEWFIVPSAGEIEVFNSELADFVDSWLGQTNINSLGTAMSLYQNPQFEKVLDYQCEGNDIRLEVFKKYTLHELHTHLGLDNGLPSIFCPYTADDPTSIPAGNKSFEGGEPVVISWHQLVFVGELFSRLARCHQANLQDIHHSGNPLTALSAIQEEWAKTPGLALLDEVGLGKTMCVMAAIATIQQVEPQQIAFNNNGRRNQNQLPPCIRDATSFGCRKAGLPSQPHLIIVPHSLVDQWENELCRFFCPDSTQIFVVQSAAKHWGKDMAAIRASKTPDILQQMFVANNGMIVKTLVNGLPRLCYNPLQDTLFSFSWCLVWIDEAREGRTGGPTWRSFSAILEAAATPLLEHPEFVLQHYTGKKRRG
ncbi:hypothetical protein BDP27DRAFT_1367225 [Rhodocollybia butyracea]|uniref:SNF2 N-terminal domain-containing protein n=1 Tax=Rhodocollybia butyracea TaxID=206335 RepID=A0A9P5U3D0_9AGAR|nr:hypothetical protein BDP27DRAFT_1367225 [Rhodocollybia butyracea]